MTTPTDHFDLIIVGSGSGNAIPEALADWRVAIVEKGTFGGTCLNVGCIPSKMFVLPADVAEAARHGSKLGVDTSFHGVDWSSIRDRVFGRIDPIAAGGEEYRATGNPMIELIRGTAQFDGARSFRVDTDDGPRQISADRVLLAAGARPSVPPIPGLADTPYHTSDTIMRLEEFPASLGVIGAGFIAAELGHVFSGYGAEVTLFNRSGRMLRAHDSAVSERFTEVFRRRVDLRLNCAFEKVTHDGERFQVHTGDGVVEVEQLLVATGRTPNTDLLNLEAAGLSVDASGIIPVDTTMATGAANIWAIGDIANHFQLKHLANREASIAFWNMTNPGRERHLDTSALPHAVFSDPQVGTVGLTEQAATAQGVSYVVGERDYGGTAFGWALDDTDSFAKVLVSPETGLLLGGHILGPQAATLIQIIAQAMQFGQTARQLAEDVYYVHPALTEVVENALIAAVESLPQH